mmetsp:Transcript_51094/g.75848  ORF Transcript_51094/g.75848 Transcript_51094/m.75848 type:complete len:416 (+) Transcript_51094:54-1301(+)
MAHCTLDRNQFHHIKMGKKKNRNRGVDYSDEQPPPSDDATPSASTKKASNNSTRSLSSEDMINVRSEMKNILLKYPDKPDDWVARSIEKNLKLGKKTLQSYDQELSAMRNKVEMEIDSEEPTEDDQDEDGQVDEEEEDRKRQEARARAEARMMGYKLEDDDNDDDDDDDDDNESEWYQKALEYWDDDATCPATVNGMLGGFASISAIDIIASKEFVSDLCSIRPNLNFQPNQREDDSDDNNDTCACECGSGIGRVSKNLLLPLGFARCDLVEVSARLLEASPEYLGNVFASKCRFFCMGLQQFEPFPQMYDVIWIQWAICYLTDFDIVRFLKRCALGLKSNQRGVVVLKENTLSSDADEAFVLDRDDSSVTRSLPYLLHLVKLAGFTVLLQKKQTDFPDDLYPVHMIALVLDEDS